MLVREESRAASETDVAAERQTMQKSHALLICALAALLGGYILGSEVQRRRELGRRRAFWDPNYETLPREEEPYEGPPLPSKPLPPAPGEALFGARIPRTMTLLATSSGSYRVPVKILFYGQSITTTWWTDMVKKELQHRYPHANLTVENRAIGGFGAQMLIRTAVHDVYPMYPDLIVYQVYGGGRDRTLEAFICEVRRRTTAEIMLLTHHVRNPHYDGSDEGSSTEWRHIAQKYNCELVEVREEWKQYIEENNLGREQLVAGDLIHLNSEGLKLMAAIVLRHFRYNTLFSAGWANTVRTYYAKRPMNEGVNDEIIYPNEPWEMQGRTPVGASPENPLELTFVGNRVDIIPGWSKAENLGTAKILIDGKPPSEAPRLYAVTRSSPIPNFWWPAILRIGSEKPLLIENWTMRITEVDIIKDEKNENNDSFTFSYEVEGSETGPDGSGSGDERFVSDSGRVVIEPRDLMFQRARGWRWTWPKVDFEVKWKVVPKFVDVYRAKRKPGEPRITTVAAGLTNEQHTLRIIPNGDGSVPIRAVRIYRPPMK